MVLFLSVVRGTLSRVRGLVRVLVSTNLCVVGVGVVDIIVSC